MYTVDASVWVNGFDQREAGHATSRQLLEVLRTRALPIIVPNLVLAEVAGAISRTRNDPVRAEAFATTLGRLPNVTVVALDVALGHQARALAAQYGLRGADAVYAAVAQQAGMMADPMQGESFGHVRLPPRWARGVDRREPESYSLMACCRRCR